MFRILPRKEKPYRYKTLSDLLGNTITTSSGCMEWQGYKDKLGYGRTWRHGKAGYKAHRLSMELAGYDIEGWIVCHKCDNPSCINPNHLFLGTHTDNMRDAQVKGRKPIAKPKPPITRNIPAIHGSKAKYSSGCRCEACTAANTKYVHEYRKRQK